MVSLSRHQHELCSCCTDHICWTILKIQEKKYINVSARLVNIFEIFN